MALLQGVARQSVTWFLAMQACGGLDALHASNIERQRLMCYDVSLARAVPIPPLFTAKSQDAISGRRRRVGMELLGESIWKEKCDRSRYFCQWCHHARGPALC